MTLANSKVRTNQSLLRRIITLLKEQLLVTRTKIKQRLNLTREIHQILEVRTKRSLTRLHTLMKESSSRSILISIGHFWSKILLSSLLDQTSWRATTVSWKQMSSTISNREKTCARTMRSTITKAGWQLSLKTITTASMHLECLKGKNKKPSLTKTLCIYKTLLYRSMKLKYTWQKKTSKTILKTCSELISHSLVSYFIFGWPEDMIKQRFHFWDF